MLSRHRLSTIVNADRIIVINNGEIVEQGTHAELLQNHGYYRRLYFRQGFLEASESDSGTPFSETTCSCHQYPSNGERSWKPDAPEFIPKAYKTPGGNQSQFPLSECVPNRLHPENKGFSESTVDIYETETDDSFHIETGPEKENLPVKFSAEHTTNTNNCNQALKDDFRSSHDEPKLFYPTMNENARGNSLGFDEGYDATAAKRPAVSKSEARDTFRRGLSKSEPSNLARETSMDNDEDSGDWQTVGTKATTTSCPNKARTGSSARPRRRRNRKGRENYQRAGVQA